MYQRVAILNPAYTGTMRLGRSFWLPWPDYFIGNQQPVIPWYTDSLMLFGYEKKSMCCNYFPAIMCRIHVEIELATDVPAPFWGTRATQFDCGTVAGKFRSITDVYGNLYQPLPNITLRISSEVYISESFGVPTSPNLVLTSIYDSDCFIPWKSWVHLLLFRWPSRHRPNTASI